MNEPKEETVGMADARYPVEPLTHFTSDLLAAAGLESQKAQTVARLLVTTDMLGRRTHGVALCPLYVEQLEKGLMTPRGEPECVRDNGAVVVWDGNYLPGLWLVRASARHRHRAGRDDTAWSPSRYVAAITSLAWRRS